MGARRYVSLSRGFELRELSERQVWWVSGRRGGGSCPFNHCDVLGPHPGVFPLNLNTELVRWEAFDEAPSVREEEMHGGEVAVCLP